MHVVVVGAGVSGLCAARSLAGHGARVTVLEACDRVGGQVRSLEVDGHTVDVGAEAVHTAAPEPLALVSEHGLDGEIVAAEQGTTWIWAEDRLRSLPAGFGPAGPTRLWPMLTSGLLSPAGMLRAGLEPLVPASVPPTDISVGEYLQRRFGRQLTDRLVDPLLGGLHSGDVRKLSLQAATPQLAALAGRHRSLLLRRRPKAHAGPAFVTLHGGLASLPARMAEALTGVEIRLETAVTAVEQTRSGLLVRTESGDELPADGVVVAVPAHAAKRMVGGPSPQAAKGLSHLRAASVAVAVMTYPREAASTPALTGTGMLVPSGSGRLLKAATFLSSKWPHHHVDGQVLVRASAGRADDERVDTFDDDALVQHLHAELREATGLAVGPTTARVQRWPSTMPQLEVGHRQRIADITGALRRDLPGVVLAGAPYHGPGLAACVRSGTTAAEQIIDELEERAV